MNTHSESGKRKYILYIEKDGNQKTLEFNSEQEAELMVKKLVDKIVSNSENNGV
tara:strand:+ start:389 stop:550 length:162 start_codon:yes stop_codon:yes gene_type:complete